MRLNSARSCREVGSGRWIRLARVNPQRMHRSFGRIVCTAERTGEQHSKHGSSYVHIVLPTLVVCARLLFQDQVQVLDADFQRRNTGCRTDGQVGASDRWKKNVAENLQHEVEFNPDCCNMAVPYVSCECIARRATPGRTPLAPVSRCLKSGSSCDVGDCFARLCKEQRRQNGKERTGIALAAPGGEERIQATQGAMQCMSRRCGKGRFGDQG